MDELKEDEDFYFNEDGLMVLTAAFLKKRGYCCSSGCKHCPYPAASPSDDSHRSRERSPEGED